MQQPLKNVVLVSFVPCGSLLIEQKSPYRSKQDKDPSVTASRPKRSLAKLQKNVFVTEICWFSKVYATQQTQQRKNSFSEFTGGLKNLLRSWKYEQMCFDSRCLKEVIFLPFLPQRLKSFKENHTQKLMVKYHLLKAHPDYYDKGFLIQMTYDVFLTEEAFCGFISLRFHFKMNFYQLSTWTSVEKIISALLLCHVSV